MSAENLGRILARAIEARDPYDGAVRNGVYALSRETLERFLDQATELTAADKARQRWELEQSIARIEARYGSPPADGPVRGSTADSADGAGTEAAAVARPPDRGVPAPPAPVVDEPTRTSAGEPAGAEGGGLEDGGSHPGEAESDPERGEATDGEDGDPREADPSELAQIEATERALQRRRNLRGIAVLAATLVVFGLAYRTEEGETLRRLVSNALRQTHTTAELSSPETVAANPAPARPSIPDLVDAGDVRLRVDGATRAAREFAGRIVWKDAETGERSGRIALEGHTFTAEVVLEPQVQSGEGPTNTMMAAVRVAGLPSPLLGEPTFERFDAASSGRLARPGSAVRIGIDRILFSYGLGVGDGNGAQRSSAVFAIRMATETDERLHLFLRLPTSR